MGCSSCLSNVRAVGHFGEYVTAGPKQLFKNSGFVVAAPNPTAGMHIPVPGIHGLGRFVPGNYWGGNAWGGQGLTGLGDMFGANQTNWITGIPNEYIVGAGILVVLIAAMR